MRSNQLATLIAYYNTGRYTSILYTHEQQKADQIEAQLKVVSVNEQYKQEGGEARLIYSPSKDAFRLEYMN